MLDSNHPGAGVNGAFQEGNDLSLSTSAVATAEPGAGVSGAPTRMTSEGILAAILTSLTEDKAEDVVQIDLRGRSEMGDWMVVASGRSTRQVTALAEKLTERLKSEFGLSAKVEGKEVGDWVLIDTGDVIVHIFRPEVREFYQLEKMWLSPEAASANR